MTAAALAGLGIVLLPDWNLVMELRGKRLKILLPDYAAVPTTSLIWAVHSHQRHVPPKIRVFIDFLIEIFAKARYS